MGDVRWIQRIVQNLHLIYFLDVAVIFYVGVFSRVICTVHVAFSIWIVLDRVH